MPEDEAPQEQQAEAASSGGFLGGSKGWIILIVAEVLTVLFFLLLMHYKRGADFKEQQKEEEIPMVRMADFNKYSIRLPNLNYSVRLQTGQTATLAMELQIVLGLRPEERRKQNFEIDEEDWKKFMDALRSLEPFIRDKLQQYISQQTHAQLTSPAGQEKIKAFVKEYINSELSRLDMGLKNKKLSKERVTNVLFVTYYMQ